MFRTQLLGMNENREGVKKAGEPFCKDTPARNK